MVPLHDVARNVVRDLVLGWIQVGWIRSQLIDYPDGVFNVARDQKLLQNTCRIVQSSVVNRTPFIFLDPWKLRAVGTAVQSRFAPFEIYSTYLPGLIPVRNTVAQPYCRAHFSGRHTRPLHGSAPLKRFALGPTALMSISAASTPTVSRWPSVRLCQKPCAGVWPACFGMPIVPSKPQLWTMCVSQYEL